MTLGETRNPAISGDRDGLVAAKVRLPLQFKGWPMRVVQPGLLLAAALFAPLPAAAQQNLAVAAKAASCNSCHGPYGRSDAGIPPLAGRPANELYALLIAFKTGQRSAFVMHQHAKGYADEELRDIATYFAQQASLKERK